MVQEEPEVTEETVELAHRDDTEPPLLCVGEEPLQGRSLVGAAAVATVDIYIGDFPALDFCVGLQGGYLGIYRDSFNSLLLCAYTCINGHFLLIGIHNLLLTI